MKRFAAIGLAFVLVVALAPQARSQWVTRAYHPVWIAPQPVVVHRAPAVVYRPPVTYMRHRPILGGTVVRTRPGYRHVIW